LVELICARRLPSSVVEKAIVELGVDASRLSPFAI
jgi:hypothetical protein